LRPIFILLSLGLLAAGCGPLADHFNDKGAEAFRKNDISAAREQFKKAVLFNGGDAVYHNNLGYALYLLKDLDGAEPEFRKALSLSPEASLARQIKINQALLYCEGGAGTDKSRRDWTGKGIQALKELLAEDGSNAEFHMRLGFAYFQAANPGGGFLELDKAVQYADPQTIAHYSSQPKQGALFILDQVQSFYVRIRYFKKALQVQKKIAKLQKTK